MSGASLPMYTTALNQDPPPSKVQETESFDSRFDFRHSFNPAVTWFDGSATELQTPGELLARAEQSRQAGRRAACVIEDLTKEWIGYLQNAWDIERSFFNQHNRSPSGNAQEAWAALFPEDRQPVIDRTTSKYKHIDGMLEYHYLRDRTVPEIMKERVLNPYATHHRTLCIPEEPYSPFSHTMISYCRVNAYLYLFLVDRPIFGRCPPNLQTGKILPSMRKRRHRTDLRVQFSTTRNGAVISQLLKLPDYSLYQVFYSVFKHGWHLNILFNDHNQPECAINRSELLVLIMSSLLQTNLQAVDAEVKHISFNELREPDMSTNDKLLNLREVLSDLATGAKDTSQCVPTSVKEFYNGLYHGAGKCDHLDFRSPVEKLCQIKEDAADLQRFLMDSFQLLMSSISVIESKNGTEQNKMSSEQAARGAKLTQLAFIYVPLSFVTSIFGMNVKEVNDSPLSVWVCFVALIIVAAATALVFGWYEVRKIHKERKANAVGGDDDIRSVKLARIRQVEEKV